MKQPRCPSALNYTCTTYAFHQIQSFDHFFQTPSESDPAQLPVPLGRIERGAGPGSVLLTPLAGPCHDNPSRRTPLQARDSTVGKRARPAGPLPHAQSPARARSTKPGLILYRVIRRRGTAPGAATSARWCRRTGRRGGRCNAGGVRVRHSGSPAGWPDPPCAALSVCIQVL